MIRVGVLSGGPSNEHAVSRASGLHVLETLKKTGKYTPLDINVDLKGNWHMYGMPVTPNEVLPHVDVLFNALHGTYGEDGTVQKIMEDLHVPYTGSTPYGSAIGMHKKMAKDQAVKLGMLVPKDVVVQDYRNFPEKDPAVYIKEAVQKIFTTFAPPWVVKPIRGGSSQGVFIAKTQGELLQALEKNFQNPGDVLVEEYIVGREASIAIVDDFRGQSPYVSMPIEINPSAGRFFDYDAKYKENTNVYVPGHFTKEESDRLGKLGVCVHQGLGMRHYSRSDFIVSPKGIYFIEVNSLPGLTRKSLVPKALAAAGATFSGFLDHVIGMAIKK